MTTPPEPISQGQIVWAKIKDRNGIEKTHPVVIITDSSEIPTESALVGVAVTATFGDPLPKWAVEIPWSTAGESKTGLRRRSAAVCNWLVELDKQNVDRIIGFVPRSHLQEIIALVMRLSEEGEPWNPPHA